MNAGDGADSTATAETRLVSEEGPATGLTPPEAPAILRSRPQRWLVLSNCQTFGLANSLSLLCPDVSVETCDIWTFRSQAHVWKTRVDEYDQLIVNPELQADGIVDFASRPNVNWVPAFFFRGHHPDLCYLFSHDQAIRGPLEDYHSLIVVAAYQKGLSESEARELLRQDTYEKLGYYSMWESEKARLIEMFANAGLDIRADFARWNRAGLFMHTINHPLIQPLYDVARMVARRIRNGVVADTGILPHDNLTVAQVWPIYPEIAEHYGLGNGSYCFKPIDSYRVMGLEEYIAGSYHAYRRHDPVEMKPRTDFYSRVMDLIGKAR